MPHNPVPRPKRNFAKAMRHEPTEAEERLWQALRGRRLAGIKFRRQVPVPPYTADFLCAEARTAFLNERGFRVLRFWNDEVLREMNSVCDTIIAYVKDPTLQPWR